MPYKEHQIFVDPIDKNTKLWRFMDFTKFVSLIHTKSLFFCKASKLPDPWEGEFPRKELNHLVNNVLVKKYPHTNEYTDDQKIKEAENWTIEIKKQKDQHFINCWHYNDAESAAMWNLYLKSDEGVAIKTSINNFKKSFNSYDEDIYCGMVKYINYDEDIFNCSYCFVNLFLPYVHKRTSFIHEKEYRAITTIRGSKLDEIGNEDGIKIPVNIELLIEEIVVAPKSKDWFLGLVNETLKKFNINKSARKSILDKNPPKFEL